MATRPKPKLLARVGRHTGDPVKRCTGGRKTHPLGMPRSVVHRFEPELGDSPVRPDLSSLSLSLCGEPHWSRESG